MVIFSFLSPKITNRSEILMISYYQKTPYQQRTHTRVNDLSFSYAINCPLCWKCGMSAHIQIILHQYNKVPSVTAIYKKSYAMFCIANWINWQIFNLPAVKVQHIKFHIITLVAMSFDILKHRKCHSKNQRKRLLCVSETASKWFKVILHGLWFCPWVCVSVVCYVFFFHKHHDVCCFSFHASYVCDGKSHCTGLSVLLLCNQLDRTLNNCWVLWHDH